MILLALRITGLIVLTVIVGFLLLTNATPTTFTYYPGVELTMPLGALVLAALFCGALLALFFAAFRAFALYRRERKLSRQENLLNKKQTTLDKARSLDTLDEAGASSTQYQNLIAQFPHDYFIVAEYAHALIKRGRFGEASTLLQNARTQAPQDPALLRESFALALQQNQPIIALEQLTLLAEQQNTPAFFSSALALAIKHQQWSQGSFFLQKLMNLVPLTPAQQILREDLLAGSTLDKATLSESELEAVTKKYSLALQPAKERARILRREQKVSEGGEVLAKVAKARARQASLSDGFIELADYWQQSGSLERALAALELGLSEISKQTTEGQMLLGKKIAITLLKGELEKAAGLIKDITDENKRTLLMSLATNTSSPAELRQAVLTHL